MHYYRDKHASVNISYIRLANQLHNNYGDMCRGEVIILIIIFYSEFFSVICIIYSKFHVVTLSSNSFILKIIVIVLS